MGFWKRWTEGAAPRNATARLCCVYTSLDEAGWPLDVEGRCPAWHVDFHSAEADRFFLVRVAGGRAKGREAKRPAVEYAYALYGGDAEGVPAHRPAPLPERWVDSPAVARAAFGLADQEVPGPERADYLALALCLPAACLRVGAEAPGTSLLQSPPPSRLGFAVLLCHVDIEDHDALVAYVDVASGNLLHAERFRFPSQAGPGISRDW